ncbi:hypothetical protein TIFTF001_029484 [Ficus carica]|uniref:Uncharacterized protein n=1 Tax=Ficus carica TaxID=3494 RepID=A0AA88DRU1_FICCA|nr:hypothetical protein TIFTF001_029484 [Ficus carica]
MRIWLGFQDEGQDLVLGQRSWLDFRVDVGFLDGGRGRVLGQGLADFGGSGWVLGSGLGRGRLSERGFLDLCIFSHLEPASFWFKWHFTPNYPKILLYLSLCSRTCGKKLIGSNTKTTSFLSHEAQKIQSEGGKAYLSLVKAGKIKERFSQPLKERLDEGREMLWGRKTRSE